MILKKFFGSFHQFKSKFIFHILWYILINLQQRVDKISLIRSKHHLISINIYLKEMKYNSFILHLNIFRILIVLIQILLYSTNKLKIKKNQNYSIFCLFQNDLIELPTGEGKTLVLACTSLLHLIHNQKVHLITANSYLAKRDYSSYQKLYSFLGFSSCLIHLNTSINLNKFDIIYGTAEDFVFYFLRSKLQYPFNMKKINYDVLLIDEIDHFLIDVINTPLRISKMSPNTQESYDTKLYNSFMEYSKDHYMQSTSKKKHNFHLSFLSSYGFLYFFLQFLNMNYLFNYKMNDISFLKKNSFLRQYVIAYKNLKRNENYIVYQNQIILINRETSRLMIGHKYSNELHQILEVKENVKKSSFSNIISSIFLYEYFEIYQFCKGLTGTLDLTYPLISNNYFLIKPNKNKLKKNKNFKLIKYSSIKNLENDFFSQVFYFLKRMQPNLFYFQSLKKLEQFIDAFSLIRFKKRNVHFLRNQVQSDEENIIAQSGKIAHLAFVTPIVERGTDISMGGLKKTIKDKNIVLLIGGLGLNLSYAISKNRLLNQIYGRTSRQGEIGEVRSSSLFIKDLNLKNYMYGSPSSTIKEKLKITNTENDDLRIFEKDEYHSTKYRLNKNISAFLTLLYSFQLKEHIHLHYVHNTLLKKIIIQKNLFILKEKKQDKTKEYCENYYIDLENIQYWYSKNLINQMNIKFFMYRSFISYYVFNYARIKKKRKQNFSQHKIKFITIYESLNLNTLIGDSFSDSSKPNQFNLFLMQDNDTFETDVRKNIQLTQSKMWFKNIFNMVLKINRLQ